LRLKRPQDARAELLSIVRFAQDQKESDAADLVQCHSRLVDLAEEAGDDYEAHLQRGIGLYLLAGQRAALDDPGGALPAEGLLCKAAAELTEARALSPGAARPCWYLHAVWSRLGQAAAARRCLNAAAAAAPFGDLTPAEQRGLVLANRERADQQLMARR
jgi:hypothetical protein